jgi:hypothetical protein
VAAQMFGTSVFIIEKFGTEDLGKRMSAYQSIIASEMMKILESKSKMTTLIHGDPWYNNFLFR